jgi:excisionase family DNA binding protein
MKPKHVSEFSHLSTVAAAEQLTVSPRTVLSWIKAGHLLAVKLPNGRYVVPFTEIERLTSVRGDR